MTERHLRSQERRETTPLRSAPFAAAHPPTGPDRGTGLVEYALLVALIALACLSALQLFGVTNGGSVNTSSSSVVEAFDD